MAQQKDPEQVAKSIKTLTSAPQKWGNYDFDIFWCEDSKNATVAKEMAQALATRVKALDPGASGRWRVKPLPALKNRESGFRVSGYQIKVSSEDEQVLGDAFSAAIRSDGVLGSQAPAFSVRRINYSTPWYLSVFVCPDTPYGN